MLYLFMPITQAGFHINALSLATQCYEFLQSTSLIGRPMSINLKTVKAGLGNDVNTDIEKAKAIPIDFDFQLHSFNNGL